MALALQQFGEVDRARLLFALDEQLDRDRRRARAVRRSQADRPSVWNSTWPLSSEAPLASNWPPRSTGSKGGESHSLSGSTGWTS